MSPLDAPLPHQGLPNEHYVDEATYRAETRACLMETWAGLAVASDVPGPGDAVPIDFVGIPLLLIRTKAGEVKVFQNVCRHRGMSLVTEPRRIEGAIRCPYHSWCYATDGRLVATPHVGGPGNNVAPGIERSELNLAEVRSHVWRDVVFIDLSGKAPPFGEHASDVIARWSEFDRPMWHGGDDSKFILRVNGNWKLAVENYCESYHLPWVHPGLNSYSRLEDHYHIERRGSFSGQGTHVYQQLRGADGAAFPDFPDLSSKWDGAAEYIALYPNVLFAVHRDHAYAMVILPEAIDRSAEHVHLYYAAPETDPALRARNCELWRGVLEEDIGVVEGMQKGRSAPGFDGGWFSPAMDGPTAVFHDWVASRMA